MEGMDNQLKAAIVFSVEQLKNEPAPTRIGHNDMAVMIAFGESVEFGVPKVSSSMISEYLSTHRSVPEGARMNPEGVQTYLDVLSGNGLLGSLEGGEYVMRSDVGSVIVGCYKRLKSPHIDDLLFHGFRGHSAIEIAKQKANSLFYIPVSEIGQDYFG